MDVQKFGAFIAENRKRKGMTQAELAQIIQVTDKAVSRWERGKGFPDINTIEPLANALEVSVLEMMKSEKIESRNIQQNQNSPSDPYSDQSSQCLDAEVIQVMKSTVEMEKENRRQERTATGLAIFTIIAVAAFCRLGELGSLGGCIFLGAIVSVAEVSIYYYLENMEDAESRKIYRMIGSIAILFILAVLVLIYYNL